MTEIQSTTTPAASAITFLSEPPSWTPSTSLSAYTRKAGAINAAWNVLTSPLLFPAKQSAAGFPALTSVAKLDLTTP